MRFAETFKKRGPEWVLPDGHYTCTVCSAAAEGYGPDAPPLTHDADCPWLNSDPDEWLARTERLLEALNHPSNRCAQ